MSSYKITSRSGSIEINVTSERISVKGDNEMAERVKRLCGYSGLNWPLITENEIEEVMGASTFHWEWSKGGSSSVKKKPVVDKTPPEQKTDSTEDNDEESDEIKPSKFTL